MHNKIVDVNKVRLQWRIQKQRWRRRHREQGLCIWCTRKAEPGYVYCSDCLAKNRETTKRWKPKIIAKRKKENKCLWCGCPLIPDEKTICIMCRVKEKIRHIRY